YSIEPLPASTQPCTPSLHDALPTCGALLDRPAHGEDAALVEVAEQPYPLGAVQLRPVAVPVARPGVDEGLHHGVDAVGEHGRRGAGPAARGNGQRGGEVPHACERGHDELDTTGAEH